jgi:signal transduction histidine kinase
MIIMAEEADVQSMATGARKAFDDTRGGLGLALPLARRVITGHGGRLWSPAQSGDVDSRARGSAVIALPIRESQR